MLGDTLITNARVRTNDPHRPRAERLAVMGGRIIAVDDDCAGLRGESEIDLGGQVVVPGFNDAHLHFSVLGQEFTQLDLSPERVATLDELYEAVRVFAEGLPERQWVIANGYDQNKIGAHPDRAVLDRILGDRPAFLNHTSKHMAVANSAAFHAAGHSDPDRIGQVDGGNVEKVDGRATGLLQEKAMTVVNHVLRPVEQGLIIDGLRAASAWAARHGLTSVTEPGIAGRTGIGLGPADLRAYQAANDLGHLRTRMNLMPFIDVLHDLGSIGGGEQGFGLDLGLRTGLGDERIRLSAVKIAADGSLIGRTAAMCCDYTDAPGNNGILQWEEAEIHDLIGDAHANGWQVAAHAIGDRALDIVLDAIEAAQSRVSRHDARHRIEHVAVASDEQVARIVRGGMIPVPQGRFLSRLGDGFAAALGPERVELAYRMRSFVDAGVELPGSSDAPVVPGEPIPSMHDMVNRRTDGGLVIGAHEALSPAQALRAYTVGSAYSSREEHRKGTLRRGQLADLVVLSDDPLQIAPELIREIKVGATLLGGTPIFDDGALPSGTDVA